MKQASTKTVNRNRNGSPPDCAWTSASLVEASASLSAFWNRVAASVASSAAMSRMVSAFILLSLFLGLLGRLLGRRGHVLRGRFLARQHRVHDLAVAGHQRALDQLVLPVDGQLLGVLLHERRDEIEDVLGA